MYLNRIYFGNVVDGRENLDDNLEEMSMTLHVLLMIRSTTCLLMHMCCLRLFRFHPWGKLMVAL